jgi:hypothetical protein
MTAILRITGRAALLRRPRIQGRAAALPYQEGEDFCPAPPAPARKKICAKAARDYVRGMDWQKIAALTAVAGTAAVFAARVWPRRRKFSFERNTHCGCGSAGPAGAGNSVVFHARKGERARVIVKMK